MADSNFLQNLSQGFQSFALNKPLSGIQDRDELRRLTQSLQQSGNINSPEFQQLAALDPAKASKIGQLFGGIDDRRQKAIFTDAREVRTRLESGDIQGALGVAQQRLDALQQIGQTSGQPSDPTDTLEIGNLIANGDIKQAISLLKSTEKVGMQQRDSQGNLFLEPSGPRAVSVQSSKIMDDGTIIEVLKTGGRQVISPTGEILTGTAAKDAVAKSRDQAFNRKKELKRLDQTIKRAEAKEGVLTAQQKLIQSGNIQRLGSLSGTSSGRVSAIKKATKFKLALEKGEAFSGATRSAASFIPGVFTSQAQFDQEFNAFAEVAARQQLKAAGEIRPTDADVQGMKQAMFGIGRDESVNIQLLGDFINDQNAQDTELDQLIDASKTGNLSKFTFTPKIPQTPQTPAVNTEFKILSIGDQ